MLFIYSTMIGTGSDNHWNEWGSSYHWTVVSGSLQTQPAVIAIIQVCLHNHNSYMLIFFHQDNWDYGEQLRLAHVPPTPYLILYAPKINRNAFFVLVICLLKLSPTHTVSGKVFLRAELPLLYQRPRKVHEVLINNSCGRKGRKPASDPTKTFWCFPSILWATDLADENNLALQNIAIEARVTWAPMLMLDCLCLTIYICSNTAERN